MNRPLARACRQAALLLFLAALPAVFSGAVQLKWRSGASAPTGDSAAPAAGHALDWKRDEPLGADEVRAATARSWGKNAVFVDARLRDRFEAGHIEGAFLLNHEEWDALVPKFLDAWDPDKKVVVYCDGGGCDAARSIAKRMREKLQIPNIYILKGGWPEWQSQ